MKFIVDHMPDFVTSDCPFFEKDGYCSLDSCLCKGDERGAVTCQGLITFGAYMKEHLAAPLCEKEH